MDDDIIPVFAIPHEWEEIEDYLRQRLCRTCRFDGPFAIDIIPAGLEPRPRFRLVLPIPVSTNWHDLLTAQVCLHPDYQ